VLGLLFSEGGKWTSEIGSQAKQSRRGTKFQMLVEEVRESACKCPIILLVEFSAMLTKCFSKISIRLVVPECI